MFRIELKLRETKNTLSHVSEKLVGIHNFFPHAIVKIIGHAIADIFVASFDDSVRCALKVDTEVFIAVLWFLFRWLQVTDEQVELDVRTEVNLVFFTI